MSPKKQTAWTYWLQSAVQAAVMADQLQRGHYVFGVFLAVFTGLLLVLAVFLFNEVQKEEDGAETDQSG